VFSKISQQLESYYGLQFEQLILELIKRKEIQLPFPFTEIRKWWYKDKEIDIVAINEETNQILVVECKWQENVDARKLLNELKEKAQHVNWNVGERKEYYFIFAKSFKEKIEEPNVFLFDLKDLEKIS